MPSTGKNVICGYGRARVVGEEENAKKEGSQKQPSLHIMQSV
jgi:hypothetical protein